LYTVAFEGVKGVQGIS